jgi:hypothetical protein
MLCSFFFPFAWPASTLPFSFVVSATTCSFSYQPAAGRMGSIQGWARTSVLLEHEQILAITTSPCAGGTASLQSSEQARACCAAAKFDKRRLVRQIAMDGVQAGCPPRWERFERCEY